MKRSVKFIALTVFILIMFAGGSIFAQQPLTRGPAKAQRLCDLTIADIYLVKDCRVAVVVKNLGPGPVPNDVWTVHTPKSAGVYLYINGNKWGGGTIWGFDSAKHLQPPGGKATYVSTLQVTGTASIKAVVDLWNVVTEGSETNNKRTERLTCETTPGEKECCIGGTYDGVHTDTQSATCPNPSSGKFVMVINQTNCGSNVTGKITDPSNGNTWTFTGTVTPAGKCCRLKGVMRGIIGTPTGGETTNITATLCKNKLGKWFTNNGTYQSPGGCGGKFEMKQQ